MQLLMPVGGGGGVLGCLDLNDRSIRRLTCTWSVLHLPEQQAAAPVAECWQSSSHSTRSRAQHAIHCRQQRICDAAKYCDWQNSCSARFSSNSSSSCW